MRIVECYIDCKAKYYYYAKYYQMLFFSRGSLSYSNKKKLSHQNKNKFFYLLSETFTFVSYGHNLVKEFQLKIVPIQHRMHVHR